MKAFSFDDLIHQGTDILNSISHDFSTSISMFKIWRTRVISALQNSKIPEDSVILSLHYKQNKFSEEESKKSLANSINNTIIILNDIIHEETRDSMSETLSETTALFIIRRIINNFHIHIKEMYQEKVHGNGTLRQEDLDKIVIGNEYDVQRMFFSLIRPIFPSSRLEVHGDTGYIGMRYDILIEDYNIIIETKCSRPSMSERSLTEELGADGFNYKSKHLFIFIYDKDSIIKNPDAFKASFKRDEKYFDKNVEVFITQPVRL